MFSPPLSPLLEGIYTLINVLCTRVPPIRRDYIVQLIAFIIGLTINGLSCPPDSINTDGLFATDDFGVAFRSNCVLPIDVHFSWVQLTCIAHGDEYRTRRQAPTSTPAKTLHGTSQVCALALIRRSSPHWGYLSIYCGFTQTEDAAELGSQVCATRNSRTRDNVLTLRLMSDGTHNDNGSGAVMRKHVECVDGQRRVRALCLCLPTIVAGQNSSASVVSISTQYSLPPCFSISPFSLPAPHG